MGISGSRSNNRWMRCFWWATAVAVTTSLVLTFVDGAARTALACYASTIAMVSGTLMARRLSPTIADAPSFLKATTVTRTLAATWLLLAFPVVVAAMAGALIPGASAARISGFVVGAFGGDLIALVGYASLIAMIGPGYGEYREGLALQPQAVGE